ncbi:hypothetical protein PJI16_06335 [Nitrospira sp. MA-1]|nr:hypothetical protein [Nitrospira sp. MA-1]
MNLVDQRRRASVWLSAAFVGVCILGVGQVEAAKMPKVEICHFDADEGVFKKISVSGNAVPNHLANHGDIFPGESNGDGSITLDSDCMESMAPAPVLVRAYIDKNRNGVYDSSVDLEIAKLLDTDTTAGLSEGDTIELSQYPMNYDPCPAPPSADPCTDIGFFAPLLPLEVLSIDPGSSMSGSPMIVSSAGARYTWENSLSGSRFRITDIPQSTAFADIIDSTVSEVFDLVSVSMGGESNAGVTAANPSSNSPQDDYFINVEFPQVP